MSHLFQKRKKKHSAGVLVVFLLLLLCGLVSGSPNGYEPSCMTSMEQHFVNIARWNTTGWSALGEGRPVPTFALATYQNQLIAGGLIDFATDSIVQWDGATWSLLRHHYQDPLIAFIHSLYVYNNQLIAGGFFFGETGIHGIGYYDNCYWYELGNGGVQSPEGQQDVLTLSIYQDKLVVGGRFKWVGGTSIVGKGFAFWDGTIWEPLGLAFYGQNFYIASTYVSGDKLYVAGSFEMVEGRPCKNLAIYGPFGENGTYDWSEESLITDINGPILCVDEYQNDLIVGGFFTQINGITVNHIARWDGTTWHALESGVTGVNISRTRVDDIFVYNGHLIVGGDFETAGDVQAFYLALWDGAHWSSMGNPFNQPYSVNWWHGIYTMENYQGDLIVAGNFISLNRTTLSIDVKKQERNLTFVFQNHGDTTAVNVQWEAAVAFQGLFRSVQKNYSGNISSLVAQGESTAAFNLPIFGLGKLDIQASIVALNADVNETTAHGFLIGPWFFLR